MSKKSSNTGVIDKPDLKDKEKNDYKKPPMYKVIIHNDDYTSMEFVVELLIQVFNHSEPAAFKVMLNVHNSGKGVAGVYTREIAETKAEIGKHHARKHDFPLELTIEPE